MEEVVIQKLLDMGMDPAKLSNLYRGWGAAHMAVSCDNVDMLMLLPPESLTRTTFGGRTPLHLAVHRSYVQVVQWLLERPCCPVNVKDVYGQTAEEDNKYNYGVAAEAIRAAFAAHRRWTALRAVWVAAAAAASPMPFVCAV